MIYDSSIVPFGQCIVQRGQQALQQWDHGDHPRRAHGGRAVAGVNLDSWFHIHTEERVRGGVKVFERV